MAQLREKRAQDREMRRKEHEAAQTQPPPAQPPKPREMEEAQTSFDTIVEKVDYIKNHLTTLETVLLNDDALGTMLIDMINKNKYGKDCPNTTQISIPRPYK